jgi:hypothetical protein
LRLVLLTGAFLTHAPSVEPVEPVEPVELVELVELVETRVSTGSTAVGRTQAGSPPSSGTGMPEGSAGTYFFLSLGPSESEESAAMNASFGTSTEPMFFMRFLPSFCFSSSLRLRLMSPP